jgi:DNA-binding NtrC family response regulator
MSTVLVIDDDRSVHRLVAQALVSTPLEVWTALDVYEGLALVERRPDLVLLDIVLPDISGLEAAAQIRAIDPKLPVIFITGQGTSETAIEAMKTGAYDYLPKPLNLARLRELVERALEIRRLTSVPVGLPSEQPTSERGEYLLGNSPPMQTPASPLFHRPHLSSREVAPMSDACAASSSAPGSDGT